MVPKEVLYIFWNVIIAKFYYLYLSDKCFTSYHSCVFFHKMLQYFMVKINIEINFIDFGKEGSYET